MAEKMKKPEFSVVTRSPDASRNGIEPGKLDSPDDPLNKEIIQMLEADGRRPFAEIAAALDVSEGTIRNRVNGMRQSGQMRIVPIVDSDAAAYESTAMICLKVSASSTPSAVARRLNQFDELVYILWVSGRYDLMVEIVGETADSLIEFLDSHIHGNADIASAEVMTGLKSFKNQFLLKRNWT